MHHMRGHLCAVCGGFFVLWPIFHHRILQCRSGTARCRPPSTFTGRSMQPFSGLSVSDENNYKDLQHCVVFVRFTHVAYSTFNGCLTVRHLTIACPVALWLNCSLHKVLSPFVSHLASLIASHLQTSHMYSISDPFSNHEMQQH